MPTANIGSARSIATEPPAWTVRWRAGALLFAGLLLAAAAPARPPNADPAFPFSNEIEAFAAATTSGAAVREGVLFLGSSSIRLWDIAGSFRDRPTINRGFGGATTAHVLHYYKCLLPPAPPRSVVVYVGENDLAAGTPPDAVSRDALTLLKRLRADYPRARIAFLSLKPSPIRWTLRPKMAAVNAVVAARAKEMGVTYLDVGSSLLAPDGLPDASLFRVDGLHMNARGYERWTRLVNTWLDQAAPKSS